MAGDFFPRIEAKIPAWSGALRDKIVASAESYGLDQQTADDYSVLHDLFVEAYLRAVDPSTRTSGAVRVKNEARQKLESAARQVARIAKACPHVSPEQRVILGLNPRDRGGRNPRVPRPDSAPLLAIESVKGRTVHLWLGIAGGGTRRGRAVGAKYALVYRFAGDQPPTKLRDWGPPLTTITTRVAASFEPDVPAGAKVSFSAVWANARGERGPGSAVVSTHIGSGVTSSGGMRLAA